MSDLCQQVFVERPFVLEDAGALVEIEKQSGNASWSRRELLSYAHRLDSDIRVLENASEESGHPIAFYAVVHGDTTLYISNLAVASQWRRRGVGLATLQAAIDLGRDLNYRKVALDVQEENLAAQLLYRKAGFYVVKILRDHYREEFASQDGYRMEMQL